MGLASNQSLVLTDLHRYLIPLVPNLLEVLRAKLGCFSLFLFIWVCCVSYCLLLAFQLPKLSLALYPSEFRLEEKYLLVSFGEAAEINA